MNRTKSRPALDRGHTPQSWNHAITKRAILHMFISFAWEGIWSGPHSCRSAPLSGIGANTCRWAGSSRRSHSHKSGLLFSSLILGCLAAILKCMSEQTPVVPGPHRATESPLDAQNQRENSVISSRSSARYSGYAERQHIFKASQISQKQSWGYVLYNYR